MAEFHMTRVANHKTGGWTVTLVAAVFAAIVLSGGTPVAAQDLQTLLDRIERLERDIRTLNVQVARDGSSAATQQAADSAGAQLSGSASPSNAGVAHLDARITALENDLRAVTGSVEELGFQISQLTTRIDTLIGDVDFRLSELERGGMPQSQAQTQAQAQTQSQGTFGSSATGDGLLPVPEGSATQTVTPQTQQGSGILGTITEDQLNQVGVETQTATSETNGGEDLSGQELAAPEAANEAATDNGDAAETEVAALTPQDQYAQAFALLRQAKFEEAAAALQAFVDAHPEHDLTSNARYWLGETYYVRSEFVRAAEVFFEAYRLAPSGPKAPDTLLKLGMALGNLNKKAEACAAFAKLAQEFPQPPAAIATKLDRERARNACGSG